MINPIHISGTPENLEVQSFDVRLYLPRGISREILTAVVMVALTNSPDLKAIGINSAYELANDGFGRLYPNDDKRLA
jgi:hypothetical protein